MKKNLLQRAIIIAVVTLAALWIVVGPRHRPTLGDFTLAGINNTLRENIRLGLDLRGGSHLVMRVQVEDYLRRLTVALASGLENAVRTAGYNVKEVRPEVSGDTYRIVLEANEASKLAEMRDQLPQKINDFNTNDWSASISGNRLTWELTAAAKRTLGQQAVDQTLRIIESRINTVGVAEPTLQEHGAKGSHQILLQMPGIQDPERVKQLMVAQSRLELMKVISPPSPSAIQTYATREEAVASLGGQVPNNRRVLPYSERDEPTAAGETPEQQANQPKRWVVVENPPVIEGSELRSADAVSRSGRDDDYQISFTLKPSGAQKFGNWTGANVNQYMAVVLNDEVKSAPYIKSQISDQGEISGRFTKQSAEDLALTLRSGALPATIEFQEERTVGPSLGQDSIRAGVTASIAGLVFVVLFMVFYYRGSGVNAVIALLLNMILTMAALVVFGSSLTLPGIAGIIL
ncbi:MAG: protein translocase subunit SecD, partial [Pyrinomonadaceae bacterium]